MADISDHELAAVNIGADVDDTNISDLQSLPPVDRGKQAWLTLAACFFLEATVWGYAEPPLQISCYVATYLSVFRFIQSYGVIQDYYLQHEPFKTHSEGIAAVSTTAMAIMLMGSPFISLGLQLFPNTRRVGGCVGLAFMFSGLMIASSTDSPLVVLWTQGVMYGIGALLVYFPAMFLIDEWFVERKGLAFGISWAGTGVGGVYTPFLLQWLLNVHGRRTTLRVFAGIIVSPCHLPTFQWSIPNSSRLRPRYHASSS